ncbi:MAG: hypothetical protein JSV53_04090 [candidate division WOR-3 bacterium]|nr:MAG: hypothetical protein JSV53_04090 [candidate division WOR-3 bacterium]
MSMLGRSGCMFVVSILLLIQLSSSQPPDTMWTRTYGTVNDDFCLSGRQTSDGGYIMTGEVSISGWWYGYLLKTDPSGDSLWMKLYNFGSGHDVLQTADSGYFAVLVFGGLDYDIRFMKTDKYGDTLWTKDYISSDADWVHKMEATADGGYIIVGEKNAQGIDVYLMKTDSLGDTLWTRTYGGIDDDAGLAVKQTNDSGYIIVGRTRSFGAGNYDVYMVKTDSDGDTLWTRVYGGVEYDAGVDVCQTGDGGYMVAASTQSFGAGYGDIWLLRTDSLGDTLWIKTCGTNDFENCTSMAQVDDGYVLTGRKGFIGPSDMWFVKIDPDGDTCWTCIFGGTEGDYPNVVRQTSDEGYIIFGKTWSFGAGSGDIYMVKTAPEVGVEENSSVKIECEYTATIFRGPLQLSDGRKCKVLDITGRVVEPDRIAPGIYFVEIDNKIVQKVIKIR